MSEPLLDLRSFYALLCLCIFLLGYLIIAFEEKIHINKAKPSLLMGILIIIIISIAVKFNGGNQHLLEEEISHLFSEITDIFFFLFVAMTYIETLIKAHVFRTLRYKLLTKGFSYKQLFWSTGLFAFLLSPVADNLTTALILSTVLVTIDKNNKNFLVPSAINIVVAANAGGAFSPFGDITTLMTWTAGKGSFLDFFYLFIPSLTNWLVTAYLLSLFIPKGKPDFDSINEPIEQFKPFGKSVIVLGIMTIISAVLAHQVLNLPAFIGMLFGLGLLNVYSFFYKKSSIENEDMGIFSNIGKIEHDTLLFFMGIIAAVGGLQIIGYLGVVGSLYKLFDHTLINISIGVMSAVIDNVPIMFAVIKTNPHMEHSQWMLVTLTAGIGGSLLSIGSAAGVGVMGKMKGIYTFGSHMKYTWTVLVGYLASIVAWYIQFILFKIY